MAQENDNGTPHRLLDFAVVRRRDPPLSPRAAFMSYHNHKTIFDMAQRCACHGLAEDLDQLRVCAATCIPKQMRHTTDIAHATTPARNRVVPKKTNA
jgi:hypothetical protein